jgi:ATP phosphoribosyltransferase
MGEGDRMRDVLTLALPKGRLLNPSIAFLKKVGIVRRGLAASSRKLLFDEARDGIRILIVRAADVPTYVEYGAADAGIVGRDMLLEQERDVYEPLDLRFGACRLVVARPKRASVATWPTSKIRVATKYPRVAEQFFSEKGLPVEIIKLSGSVELAPLVGLAECIVDLITTGRTLRENHLVEEEVITDSTARLILNRASLKTKTEALMALVDRFKAGVEGIAR